jgi:hypothetical protein
MACPSGHRAVDNATAEGILQPQDRDWVVPAETRNAIVVALLIASLTVGAGLLLWMEPPARAWGDATLLMARNGQAVEQIEIVYVPQASDEAVDEFDCLVYPDGQSHWQARGSRIRVALLGSNDERLARRQAETLLAVLGNLDQRRPLRPGRVWLAEASDPRVTRDLPRAAQDLMQLLLTKGLIR